MSYEYKDVFIESLSNFIYPGKIFDDSLSELDHVYTQAAKADEYEVKAKAFDRIVKESKGAFTCDDVRHIINNYEIGVDRDD